MKTEKLVWGMILIFIGGVFLLENFDIIDFYWFSIFKFWPLILIVIGVNLLFSRTDTAVGPYISVLLTLIVLAFIFYQGVNHQKEESGWFHFNADTNESGRTDTAGAIHLSEPWEGGIGYAELNIRGGATSYSIGDTTGNLIDGAVHSKHGNYTLTTSVDDSVKVINLNMNTNKRGININGFNDNSARIKLNTAPFWDINVNVGAGESNFDLRAFKVRRLDFKGGAASFKAKMGEPQGVTYIEANTGVSEVVISIPKASACEILVSSGLSSREFGGFKKQKEGHYETPGFNRDADHFTIQLKGGLSDFEVRRY